MQENHLTLALQHFVTSGRADVQGIGGRGILFNFVDDPVYIRLLAVEDTLQAAIFRSHGSAGRVFLKAQDGFLKSVKSPCRLDR